MKMRNLLTATVAAIALLGPATLPAAAQPDKSQLVVGQLQFLKNFHPLIQVNNTKRLQVNYGLLPLTAFDQNAENQCILCKELPSLENGLAEMVDNPDGTKGMRVKFTLLDGLSWGDGEPVTSQDVAFTLKMANDPDIGFSEFNPWTRASDIEIVDDRTFVLILSEVTPSFASWDQVLPSHLEAPIYEANGTADSYVKQTHYNTDPTNPGLWNAAYMLSEYQIGTRLTWVPNPHWPGKKPEFERIILSYRDNSSALVQNLLAGEIDAVPVSPGGISFSQMLDVQRQKGDGLKYHIVDGTNLERIAMNLDNPILADVKVRRALMMGIDRKAITEALFEGQQPVANGLLPDSNPFFNPDITRYSYDPDAAKALLQEAGWTQGGDGICVNDKGERLSFDLATTAGNQTREQIALVIQSQLGEICVDIKPTFVPLQEYNGELSRRRNFSGLIMSSIRFSPSTTPGIAVASDAIPTAENNWVGNNFSGYSSPEMDAALNEFQQALSAKAQRAAWQTIQQQFAEDLPMLPLYFYAEAYVTVPDLSNFNVVTYDPLMIWAQDWKRE
ncbi:peptide ABC transporter substrate-binding protein [Pseudorhizobium pelagicum]|uniref:Peptide ABC transporter substrate-binding protein n=1 Tax=Pseudorhizobium pelagicum TaxID=1509405 RepID=A0A922P1I5_9HYPH|nr:peptide ABC transporter substrate-binding protein [Pseudorhizobium pelagicum]KEQ08305.1 peptide ABC transporter substrate-binding protein [Pseudorhizobium pelagicum]KEQ09147.1 peptide ABC transporter substrate-binding protein [Pseudorhizobium pelagicum]